MIRVWRLSRFSVQAYTRGKREIYTKLRDKSKSEELTRLRECVKHPPSFKILTLIWIFYCALLYPKLLIALMEFTRSVPMLLLLSVESDRKTRVMQIG